MLTTDTRRSRYSCTHKSAIVYERGYENLRSLLKNSHSCTIVYQHFFHRRSEALETNRSAMSTIVLTTNTTGKWRTKLVIKSMITSGTNVHVLQIKSLYFILRFVVVISFRTRTHVYPAGDNIGFSIFTVKPFRLHTEKCYNIRNS